MISSSVASCLKQKELLSSITISKVHYPVTYDYKRVFIKKMFDFDQSGAILGVL
ncbi:hypothetical protein HH304_20795 [Flammeovirgaceae bacterium KN852]|uniref:Uncharacterized protein n=1 Tax=Marinigracilibium pacificum TaxID=2729599 RepID=A0A848J8P2_9BACT|nr:hypothetical protein [Marinigracilibium pacificum]